MQLDNHALAKARIHPDHPLDHTVDVRRLTEPLLSVVMEALNEGYLSCFTAFGRQLWVSRAQLAAVVGFGRKVHNPTSPYFVPPDAILQVPYAHDPITDASPAYQRRHLTIARHAADYLAALRSAMPPRPYDLHVKKNAHGSPLVGLIHRHRVDARADDTGWWVISVQVAPFVPDGESLDDPTSIWFVGPGDRADQDEVDRLTDEHRRHWPEIYLEHAPAAPRHSSSNPAAGLGRSICHDDPDRYGRLYEHIPSGPCNGPREDDQRTICGVITDDSRSSQVCRGRQRAGPPHS